jgi:hypothetical protein
MMADASEDKDYLWNDLIQVNWRRGHHLEGASHAIVLTDGSREQEALARRRARKFVDTAHISVAAGSGSDTSSHAAATLHALVHILIDDPDAMIVLAPTEALAGRADEFARAIARAFFHIQRWPDLVVAIEGNVLVGRGRTMFSEFARAMPRLARLFTFYAGRPDGEDGGRLH